MRFFIVYKIKIWRQILLNLPVWNFVKICSVIPELFHVCRKPHGLMNGRAAKLGRLHTKPYYIVLYIINVSTCNQPEYNDTSVEHFWRKYKYFHMQMTSPSSVTLRTIILSVAVFHNAATSSLLITHLLSDLTNLQSISRRCINWEFDMVSLKCW
jgi:hypothetical protein